MIYTYTASYCLYDIGESFDIGICDLYLCISLESEEEANILVVEVENTGTVFAHGTKVVLLDEEINDGIHSQTCNVVCLSTLLLSRCIQILTIECILEYECSLAELISFHYSECHLSSSGKTQYSHSQLICPLSHLNIEQT